MNSNKGAALIMVLLVAAILGAITSMVVFKTKQQIIRLTILKDYMHAERIATSDLNNLIFEAYTSSFAIMGNNELVKLNQSGLPENKNIHGEPFNYGESVISIQDMAGLITLVPLNRELISKYLAAKRWSGEQIYRFIDVLDDWQDNDYLERVNGAESSKYSVSGYPLNQYIQDKAELSLLVGIDQSLLAQLIRDENIIPFGVGTSSVANAPDSLLPYKTSEFDANALLKNRLMNRQQNVIAKTNEYSSSNWIVKVKTSYGEAKSSKIIHLLRRFGEERPLVISKYIERAH